MASFDELMAESNTRSHGCRVCDKPNVGQVQVRMSRLENGKASRTITKTRSYCAEHAVAAFEAATKAARL